MNIAVALTRTYLQLNGYFTVTEYPLLAAGRGQSPPRTMTDIDVLAFRLAHPGGAVVGTVDPGHPMPIASDPALACPQGADMIVGEVKEGPARFNRAARAPAVLAATLARFGCCSERESERAATALLRNGSWQAPHGHTVQLVAFGASTGTGRPYHVMTLEHMLAFVQHHVRERWDQLAHVHLSDPILGTLALFAKAGHTSGATHD